MFRDRMFSSFLSQSLWLWMPMIFITCNHGIKTESTYSQTYAEQIIIPLQREHVHGATIVELSNGDLLTAWFQGSGERWADDVRIMGSRLIKGDTTWSRPFLMADNPGFPDINPMMFIDPEERLWLMWYVVIANQWETSIPMYRISDQFEDAGAPKWAWQEWLLVKPGDKTERGIQPGDRFVESIKTQMDGYEIYLKEDLISKIPDEKQNEFWALWNRYRLKMDSLANGRNMLRRGILKNSPESSEISLGYPLSRRIGWQTKNKPYVVGNRIIVPLYSDGMDCSLFAITDNLGSNWLFSNPVVGGIGIQPTIAVGRDGNLHAYLRDNGPPPQRMQHTISVDAGLTWTIAKDINLPNPGSGFDMITLTTGEWLMVYNHTESGRHDLSVAVSDDDGQTWPWLKQIEYDARPDLATRSHYPAVIQGSDGRIHVVYSFHHADRGEGPHKTIKYACFPLSWVKE